MGELAKLDQSSCLIVCPWHKLLWATQQHKQTLWLCICNLAGFVENVTVTFQEQQCVRSRDLGSPICCTCCCSHSQMCPMISQMETIAANPGLGETPVMRKQPFVAWAAAAGPVAKVVQHNQMIRNNVLLVLVKEIIKDIPMAPALKDDCQFQNPIFVLPAIIRWVLVTLEGEEWAKHRSIITPAFGLSCLNWRKPWGACVPGKVQTFPWCWSEEGEDQKSIWQHTDIRKWSKAVAKTAEGDREKNAVQLPELTVPLTVSMMSFLKPNTLWLFIFITGLRSLDPCLSPVTQKIHAALESTVGSILPEQRQESQFGRRQARVDNHF